MATEGAFFFGLCLGLVVGALMAREMMGRGKK
jgi:hypothetical protein